MAGEFVSTILAASPEYRKYKRVLMELENIYLQNLQRDRDAPMDVQWHFGNTSVAKTHPAFQQTCEGAYEYSTTNGKWDGYHGETTVFIKDYTGGIPFGQLLQVADKWPCNVPRRRRGPVSMVATTIYVTSDVAPEEIYTSEPRDRLDALYRRFTVFRVVDGDTKHEHTHAAE